MELTTILCGLLFVMWAGPQLRLISFKYTRSSTTMPVKRQQAKEVVDTVDSVDNENYQPPPDYVRVSYLQPHWTRRKEILAAHPEIKDLMHHDTSTAYWVVASVTFMTILAWAVKDSSWLVIFATAYLVGAFINHAQWVLIHELTHDNVFKAPFLNTAFILFANLNHIIPSSISFRYHHKMHHSHLNETYGGTLLVRDMQTSPVLPFAIH